MKKAIIRVSVLSVLLLNQTLILFGVEPLPFSDEAVYEGVSSFVLVVFSLYTAYKNNDFTKEAEVGTRYMENLKETRKDMERGVR